MSSNVAETPLEPLKSSIKVAQSSITSFFKPKAPSYALAPSKSSSISSASTGASAPLISTPATVVAEQPKKALSPPAIQELTVESPTESDDADYSAAVAEQLKREQKELSPAPKAESSPSLPAVNPKSSKSLPPQASIVPIQPDHVSPIKRINSMLLCISYPSWFYSQLSPPTAYGAYSRAILWDPSPPHKPKTANPIVVGSLITRRDPVSEFKKKDDTSNGDDSSLYIAALTLLSPYRHYGLATAALESVIRQITATTTGEGSGVKSLYCHVWTNNTEGLDWYKKQGFRVDSTIDDYYQKLSPSSAHILRRDIGVLDRSGPFSSSSSTLPASAAAGPPKVRPGARLNARSFMEKGPENEWNDLPEHMVVPRSGPPSAARSPAMMSPATSAPPSGPPSRSPSVPPSMAGVELGPPAERTEKKKKRSRAYPAAALNGDVVNGSGSGSQA